MMNFDRMMSVNAFRATNSIKPVVIEILDDNVEPEVLLHMPKGDLYIDAPITDQWFRTFEEAKKWAEHRVGVQMKLEI